jgi:hypothetical protein
MSSSNNSGERCCCFLFPIRRDRCERAFERFEQVTVSHGRPQTSQNVPKRAKTSQNIPMSEIGWAMPVTAEAGENTTVAPVPANAVQWQWIQKKRQRGNVPVSGSGSIASG